MREPLLLVYLPDKSPIVSDALIPRRRAVSPPVSASGAHIGKREVAPDNPITIPPEGIAQPKIDWQHEAELATRNGVATAERELV
jgi:hypothetical protein